ncbi:MAG: homocitrate synthase [Chloroflexi bacterium]|nr:homocitrate synthase [Chloroflexota bacterium]
MPEIHFIDVTNRDGVQTARITLSKFQKTMLNMYLSKLGVHQSEIGFPFLQNERNYIQANLELQAMGFMGTMVLAGWCRAVVRDVDFALTLGLKDLNISISTSDQMITHKFQGKLVRETVVKEMMEAARLAKEGGVKTLGANAEDASRTGLDYLVEFAQAAKEAGADRIRYCDTVGCDSPMVIYRRVRELAERVGMAVELHCHNDLGMAVANSVAGAWGAIDAGVDAYINTSINGIGERAGQADLLSCVLALTYGNGLKGCCKIGDNIDLKMAWRLARYASYAFQVPIPMNQPGVGGNAFAHESGIHADGALKDRNNYELFDYEAVGRTGEECENTGRVISTGEYGGLAGLKHVYAQAGLTFSDDREAQRILELVQYANAHNQLPLTDDELAFIHHYPEQVRKILTITP